MHEKLEEEEGLRAMENSVSFTCMDLIILKLFGRLT